MDEARRRNEKTPQPITRPAGDVESRRLGGREEEMAAGCFARLVFKRAIDAMHADWSMQLEQSK